ncbi:MAG TPA: DUF4434 domain-containing protein [Jiangellaceae bacterium]
MLTFRSRSLLAVAAVVASGAAAACGAPDTPSAVTSEFAEPAGGNDDGAMSCTTEPRLTGTFLQPYLADSWTAEQWSVEFGYLREACISDVVLQWTADTGARTVAYPAGLDGYGRSTTHDVVRRALEAADDAGADVYLGLQVNDEWWRSYASDPEWLSGEARIGQRLIDDLWARYGSFGSLAGWYVPFEVDNWNLAGPQSWAAMASFYTDVAGHAKRLTPELPVVVAPFFNPAGGLPPDRWTKMWASILSRADIDAIALQDGVGAGHASADQLAAWFEATAAAIDAAGTKTELWATTETFTPGFGSMDIGSVVADMLAVQPYVSRFWSFSYNHYQSPQQVDPALHRAYLDYLVTGPA